MEEMKMNDVIARINALAHKAKVESLTPEELAAFSARVREYRCTR